MKTLKTVLILSAVATVVYLIYKKTQKPEEKASAIGHHCRCQGRYNGKCVGANCCERRCRHQIFDKVNRINN